MYKKKLIDLGIPASILGFEYLNYAIQHYCPGMAITGTLYPSVANHFHTTCTRAERAMRHAVHKVDENISVSAFVAKYKVLWSEDT